MPFKYKNNDNILEDGQIVKASAYGREKTSLDLIGMRKPVLQKEEYKNF